MPSKVHGCGCALCVDEAAEVDFVVGDDVDPTDAAALLDSAAEVLKERGKTRDSEETGERAMVDIVRIFNAMTLRDLTELEGWKFMVALKYGRMMQGGFNPDDYVDSIGYNALMAECALKEKR